jgi:uncharacterized repeat protein (TIGR03803 family)
MSKLKSSWWKTACAVAALSAATAIAAPAQTFTTLASFELNETGAKPFFPTLVQGTDGSLYGTAEEGGLHGSGTIFKLTAAGALTTLYSFCAQQNCADGAYPYAGLVLGTDGNFYGTTYGGGRIVNGFGSGTVFRVTPGGTLTVLYSFCAQANCADGSFPFAALIQATDGNFYGTTAGGGTSTSCHGGCGTIFRITPTGKLTTLHSLRFLEGEGPYAGLIQASDGNFYGTAGFGGMGRSCIDDCGTVFKITPGGMLTTLHSFASADGSTPVATLAQASDGNLYGTTEFGGAGNYGTVFRMTVAGGFTSLHSFSSTDGANPGGALLQATDGNLYGTTYGGGANGYGTIFEITTHGALSTLHNFDLTDGANPFAALPQATNGILYSTTEMGGEFSLGTVFSLDVGLGPFVEILPASSKAGAAIRILGNNLTGTTSVTFNGTPATFTVVSSTLITTTVPAGATTGPVQVTTPSGTLKSNVNFRVRQ